MAKLHLHRAEKTLDVPVGETLLRAIQGAAHPIATSCGGRASCGLCRLKVLRGKDLLTPIRDEEIVHLGSVARVIGIRLACQSVVVAEGDIEVDVPDVEDVEERKRRKAERLEALRRAPAPRDRPKLEPIEWRPRKLDPGWLPGRK